VLRFKKIYLEITNRCNLTCNFCQKSCRAKSSMSPIFFEDILRQIKPFTDHLSFHVLGEPLLHPYFGEFLDLCHRQQLLVNLTTNGTLLSQQLPTLFASPALRQVNISLHCHETMAGWPQQEAYIAGIFNFLDEAIKRPSFLISLRLWNSNGSDVNKVMLARLASFFEIKNGIADTLPTGRGIAIASRVFLSMARPFTWPHDQSPDLGENGSCLGLRSHVAILVDGTVVPCCLDAEADVSLGNIRQQPFSAIIAGERASRIRDGFRERRIIEPLCRRCSFRLAFSGKKRNRNN
jgi:radical SAM protein with 4Fe4S-binding SPASM domain